MQFTAVRDKLKGFVDNGQLGIFQNGYWGHPAMKLSPEVNLLAVSHYLEALEQQRRINQVVAILGGKTPNIQNLAVGGVANAINLDNQATLNMEKLFRVKDIIDEIQDFIQQVYFVDVCAIGWDVRRLAAGTARASPTTSRCRTCRSTPRARSFDFPGGVIMNGDLSKVEEIKTFHEPFFRENVTESIARAWYDGNWSKHPFEETTDPKYTKFEDNGEVLMGEGAALQGQPDAGGAARAGARRVRARTQADREMGDEDARHRGRDREHEADAGRPALDARPPRSAHDPHAGDRRAGAEALEPPREQHREGRYRRSSTSRSSRKASSAGSGSTRPRAARSRIGW